ncbi:MAG: GTPase Era [Spirochaetia bacterium]|nr:GTPase Era [Spirochaetia bacterium]
MSDTPNPGTKAAFVSVVGRPSAGKSTLVNALCGGKISIVSPVPQTTKNTVRGIKNDARGQLVFLDTPGIHDSDKRLNQRLRDLAVGSLGEADLILYLVDASREAGAEEEAIAALLAPFAAKTLACVNKTDLREADSKRARAFVAERLPDAPVLELSALKGDGLDALADALFARAPEGPAWYPAEYYTDQEPVFRIAEIVREKVLLHGREEVPHSVFVRFVDAQRKDDGSLVYTAELVVERESQKGILIGKGGEMIRTIREEAERDLKSIFDYEVRLSLRVAVQKDWRKDDKLIKKLYY